MSKNVKKREDNGSNSFPPVRRDNFHVLPEFFQPMFSLIQSTQNVIKRELEHSAKAIYPRKGQEERNTEYNSELESI